MISTSRNVFRFGALRCRGVYRVNHKMQHTCWIGCNGRLNENILLNRLSKRTLTSEAQNEGNKNPLQRRSLVSRKDPVEITDLGRNFFITVLKTTSRPDIAGVMLRYQQHSSGDPRMVFSFDLVTSEDIHKLDEPVSLSDELKLYIHHNAFMKVLGSTIDFSKERGLPILLDREGNELDPNF